VISIKAEITFGLTLLSLGAAMGYGGAIYWSNGTVTVAKSDTAVCASIEKASQAAVADLQAKLNAAAKERKDADAAARTVLGGREAKIKSLQAAAKKRATAISEKPHDAECAALDHVPLCPGVARELWPDSAEAAGTDTPAGR
jgi:hypothetical protein